MRHMECWLYLGGIVLSMLTLKSILLVYAKVFMKVLGCCNENLFLIPGEFVFLLCREKLCFRHMKT